MLFLYVIDTPTYSKMLLNFGIDCFIRYVLTVPPNYAHIPIFPTDHERYTLITAIPIEIQLIQIFLSHRQLLLITELCCERDGGYYTCVYYTRYYLAKRNREFHCPI